MDAASSSVIRPQAAANYVWVLAAAALVACGAASGIAIAYGEMGAFYVSLSLILCLAILFDFRIGATALIVILPLSQTHLFPHSLFGITALNPFNVLIAATLVSYALRAGLAGLAPRPLVWLYGVPILIAGLLGMPHVQDIMPYFFDTESIAFTDAYGYFGTMALRPLLIVLVALLAGAAVVRSQRPERFVIAIMVSVWIMALLELAFIAAAGVQLGVLASPFARDFFEDMGLHANDLGRLFAVAYALLLFVWWETRSPGLKTALLATLGVTTLALLLSFSRGGYLGFFLASALFVLWKFNARTVSLALTAAVLAAALAPEAVYDRLTFGFDADMNAVSAGRIDGIWLPLLPELGRSPVWGSGLGSVMWSQPMLNGMMSIVGHAHNAYLEAALDMGFVGLGLLLAYYWHVWKGLRALGSNAYLSPEMRGLFQGAAAALMCVLVTGWTGSSLRPEIEFGFLWVAIGMMYGMLARKPSG